MYHIIINPISGRKKSNLERTKPVFDYLDENHIEYDVYETKYAGHPKTLANEITTKFESGDLIIIGGDGTFSEVFNGINDLSKWNIGLIQAGSGNDFAHILNIPTDPLDAIKAIVKGNIKKTDYIKVNDGVCMNVLGTGIDVEVLVNFEKHTKLKGSFRYLVSLLEALLHIKWHEFDVSIDGGEFVHKEGFLVTLNNGGYIGGGIPICPSANPMDGKLEFVFVNKIKKIQVLKYLVNLMNGKILNMEATEHVYCEKAVFKDEKKLLLQIDGNITNDYNKYDCEIVKEGINLYL